MNENSEIVGIYERPRIEEIEIFAMSSLLTGSTSPDSVYTDGGDAW
jgi:hypothetical protein